MPLAYHKTICLDFGSEAFYQNCMEDSEVFRQHVKALFEAHPELFPAAMAKGWCLFGYTERSKKQHKSCAVFGWQATLFTKFVPHS